MTQTETIRPITLLVAALGGEGGGVLTDWIVTAGRESDLVVQSTSIPGVAQRTGATTYYVEVWPEPRGTLGGRKPILSLAPVPGEVDLLVSSELMETGRAIMNGFVTPDRTHLIASTSRVLTTKEKMAMGDGEFDADALRKAVAARSKAHTLVDMAVMAAASGAPVSAVMLGVIAGSGKLPIPRAAFEDAIRAEGKAVAANLKGFDAGFAAVSGDGAGEAPAKAGRRQAAKALEAALARRVEAYPAAVRDLVSLGVARLQDYQDARYAALYLDRLEPFRSLDEAVLGPVARHLAVRMSYEDIIRVAAAKTRPERFARIRGETEAGPDDLVRVTEFFKPGLAEICDILPTGLARRMLAKAERNGDIERRAWPMELNSTSVSGFLKLRFLASLRRIRRRTYRFGVEQASIEQWLDEVARAAALGPALAREIADCARLIKGYGSTHRRGSHNMARIREALILPALSGAITPDTAAEAIAQARGAALADPEGEALGQTLADIRTAKDAPSAEAGPVVPPQTGAPAPERRVA